MPVAATTISSLETARDNLAQVIAAQTNAWVADGCPPTYSIDGESWNWDAWLKTKCDEIDKLTATIQKLSTPWIVRSKGRAG